MAVVWVEMVREAVSWVVVPRAQAMRFGTVAMLRGWAGVAMAAMMAMASVVKALAEAAMASGAEAMGMAAEVRAATLQLERQRAAKATRA